MSNEKLVAEIMYLSALVNANTELCVFVRYSGHVGMLDVDIAESKEKYQSKIFDDEARLNDKKGTGGLEKIRQKLISVLTDHNVSYETLNFGGLEEEFSEVVTEGTELEDRMATLEMEMVELKALVSSQIVRNVAADVPEELPRSRGHRQENEE